MVVFLNGKFVDDDEAKISPFDNGFIFGDGIYETMRTYGGKLWNFEAHFRRFEASADLLQLKIPYEQAELRDLINQLIKKNGFKENRIKMILTRGVSGLDFDSPRNPTLLIYVNDLKEELKEVYENGVSAITVPFVRAIPEIKSLSLITTVRGRQEAKKKGAYEAFLLDHEGYVTEGSISNAYFIKHGDIFSPEIDMLAGTTREILLRLAGQKGFNVVFKKCEKEAFYEADEIFISNAIKGVVPVVKIDDFSIGEGLPGAVTKVLMSEWQGKIDEFINSND